MMRVFSALLVAAVVAAPALADDKKKPKSDASVDAFFDTPATAKTSVDDLSKAAAGVGAKEKKPAGMAPKTAEVNDDAPVKLYGAWAAQKIVIDKKLGCQPGGRDKKKLTFFAYDELPQQGVPIEVCLSLSSKAGREMSMSVAIVDPRNARVVKAEDVIDFRGKAMRQDHVLEFPAPLFKVPGQYQYLVELDGKEVGRLPLFEVRVEANASDAPPAPATEP